MQNSGFLNKNKSFAETWTILSLIFFSFRRRITEILLIKISFMYVSHKQKLSTCLIFLLQPDKLDWSSCSHRHRARLKTIRAVLWNLDWYWFCKTRVVHCSVVLYCKALGNLPDIDKSVSKYWHFRTTSETSNCTGSISFLFSDFSLSFNVLLLMADLFDVLGLSHILCHLIHICCPTNDFSTSSQGWCEKKLKNLDLPFYHGVRW